MAVAQKIMTLREAIDVWMNGCKELLLTVTIFAVSCLVSFSTGTSYGTTAIMIPIAFPLAMGINGGVLDAYAVLTIAAVTSGAIFGDHCSPISDTTIMSSSKVN